MSWELHVFVKGWIKPKDRETKLLVHLIHECLIYSCVKVINEETSGAETDMSMVNIPSQKLKA